MELTRTESNKTSLVARTGLALRGLVGMQEFAIIVAFLVVLVFFWWRNPAMLLPVTVSSIMNTMAFAGLIGLGLVQLMIAGEIDLSMGAMMSMAAVFCAKMIRDVFVPAGLSGGQAVIAGAVVALAAALLVGLINSALVVKIGVPAVIATIGMQFVVRGVSYSFTTGVPVYPLPPEMAIVGSLRPFGGVSFTFFLMLGLAIVAHILLSRTRWGASLFATGGNKLAAQVCGINTDRVKTICFMLTSFLAGLAGILTMSSLPQTPGDPIIGRSSDLDILAGVVIGGVSLFGGKGSAIGTFFGILFIQMVRSGIVVAHFNSYLQQPVLGFMLVLGASVDVIRHFRRA